MSNYVADGNKQVPGTFKGRNKYSTAETPAADSVIKRCTYVMINQTGSYAFSYDSGSALVTVATHNYQTASVVPGIGSEVTPFKLDINPVAWRRCDKAGTLGEITFVYVRVR